MTDSLNDVKEVWEYFGSKYPFPHFTIQWSQSTGLICFKSNDKAYESEVEEFVNEFWPLEMAQRVYPELFKFNINTPEQSHNQQKLESARIHIDRIIEADLNRIAHINKIAEDGIHELTVSDEQAVGMIGMKFNIALEDFVMPVDSMIVHFPKTIWEHSVFKDEMLRCVSYSDEMTSKYDMIQEDYQAMQKAKSDFLNQKYPVSVLVQKHNQEIKTLTVYVKLGDYCAYTMYVTKEVSIEDAIKFTQGQEPLIRAALSAVLISSMKPNLIEPREIPNSVARDRNFLIQKIHKTVPLKVLVPTYGIFQKNMKTYHDRTTTTGTGKSPSEVIIKPVFVWGHWRNQPFGPKRSQRRLQWIKSYIRNKDLLMGKDPQIITSSRFTQPDEVIQAEVDCSQHS